MDKTSLLARQASTKARFDEQHTVKEEAAAECYRLQGEHRLLTELIDLASAQVDAPQEGEGDGAEVNS